MTPAIAAENVQRLFKKIMETTLQRSQRLLRQRSLRQT